MFRRRIGSHGKFKSILNVSLLGKIDIGKIKYAAALGVLMLTFVAYGYFSDIFFGNNTDIDPHHKKQAKLSDELSKKVPGSLNKKIGKKVDRIKEELTDLVTNTRVKILSDNISDAHLSDLIKIPAVKSERGNTAQHLYTTVKDGVLEIFGDEGGFVFFNKTDASFYRVEGYFLLEKYSDYIEPKGFALVVLGEFAKFGASSETSGIGVNYDQYAKKISIERYPNDINIGVAFEFPETFDIYAKHHLRVDVLESGEFIFYLDRIKRYKFYDSSIHSGMVGVRVWGNSRVKISDLEINKVLMNPKIGRLKKIPLLSIMLISG